MSLGAGHMKMPMEFKLFKYFIGVGELYQGQYDIPEWWDLVCETCERLQAIIWLLDREAMKGGYVNIIRLNEHGHCIWDYWAEPSWEEIQRLLLAGHIAEFEITYLHGLLSYCRANMYPSVRPAHNRCVEKWPGSSNLFGSPVRARVTLLY